LNGRSPVGEALIDPRAVAHRYTDYTCPIHQPPPADSFGHVYGGQHTLQRTIFRCYALDKMSAILVRWLFCPWSRALRPFWINAQSRLSAWQVCGYFASSPAQSNSSACETGHYLPVVDRQEPGDERL